MRVSVTPVSYASEEVNAGMVRNFAKYLLTIKNQFRFMSNPIPFPSHVTEDLRNKPSMVFFR